MRIIISFSRRLHSLPLPCIVLDMPDIYAYSVMIGACIVAAASIRASIYCFKQAAKSRRTN